jgi:hypothetical protein
MTSAEKHATISLRACEINASVKPSDQVIPRVFWDQTWRLTIKFTSSELEGKRRACFAYFYPDCQVCDSSYKGQCPISDAVPPGKGKCTLGLKEQKKGRLEKCEPVCPLPKGGVTYAISEFPVKDYVGDTHRICDGD